jgi:hypothetical protein
MSILMSTINIKMLKGEIIDISSKNKYTVSFFDDDSIDIIRQKVGAAVDIHPDRLYILVGVDLPSDYYTRDARHWEALFERLSYNNEPIEQDVFSEYQLYYRLPTTSIGFFPYDKSTWMSMPDALMPLFRPENKFLEYRILGTEESRSYILPLSNLSNTTVSRISATKLPIPDNTKLFSNLYSKDQFVRFLVKPYDEEAETNVRAYFPLLRSTTPSKMTEETIRLIQKNANVLDTLLQMDVPKPTQVTIVRTRFYIPFVDTDFGSAVRTRFEQIFYGLTVTKDTPCITLFTSKDQISRHKFFTEHANNKVPYVDMSMWNSWWSIKPARNIPSLILFRGVSKHHYDRITITASDMVIATHRPEGNTETIEQIQRQLADWIIGLDAIIPFIDPADLYKTRWELQDMAFLAKYSEKLEDFDLLRFNCISNIFDIADKTKSQFNLMRTGRSMNGLSAVEVKIIQMMRESGGAIDPAKVGEELAVPLQKSRELIQNVQSRLDEDPKLGEKAIRGYPTLKLGADYSIVSAVSDLETSLRYANLLRYILSNPDSNTLNDVCPKRVERVSAETAIVPSETIEVDAAIEEEYADLFSFLESGQEEETESLAETVATTNTTQRIATDSGQDTTYGYFKQRLQKFDPITFDPNGSKYPKKCEKHHQPIILSTSDMDRLAGGPYDITEDNVPSEQRMEVHEPDGTVICPEYWCMRDQIPLQDSQLDKSDGEIKCPVCHGKLHTRTTDKPKDFPLIKRDSAFKYPGYKDYRSPRNGRMMPCCFKKSRIMKNEKVGKSMDDKYYVLGVDKTSGPERIAFLSSSILSSLKINEKYESFKDGSVRRLMSPNKGFFRAIMGRASKTLPKFLNLKTTIPSPRESIETILKCSFLHTWRRVGTRHLESIENKLKSITDSSQEQQGLAKIISGIDEAFEKEELTILEDLEYSALALRCDIFRIHTNTASLGCMFYAPMVRARTRAVIILQNEDEVDILAYTERKTRGFEFTSNIYESPFTRDTYVELEKLRNQSCKLKIPSYDDALLVFKQIMPMIDADDYAIILDPFDRGQALYVAGKMILPFQSTPLPDLLQTKISGYKEISTENLPEYSTVKTLLETASQITSGFAFKEDLYNANRQKVEILLESGLRIPVKPVDADGEPKEVIETVRDIGESELVFGEESQELKQNNRDISYSSEIYEFLLFQLTKDMESDYLELRNALREVSPNVSVVQPLLAKWFEETTTFADIAKPKQFLSKIREPCNETCDGELCGWDKGVCKVKISSRLNISRVFHKLLTALTENSKIRSIVLDGRTTPFFSTILYLELPHEVIMTDTDLAS